MDDKKTIDLVVIVRNWLDLNGYDGLYSPEDSETWGWRGACCCKKEDLFGCGDPALTCRPGYLWTGDEENDYFIRPMPSFCDCPSRVILVHGDSLYKATEVYCPIHGFQTTCYMCSLKNKTTELCNKHRRLLNLNKLTGEKT